MKAHELSAAHLGKIISFETPEGGITGLLSEVRHAAQLVNDNRIGDATERFIVGHILTHLTLAGWGERRVGSNTEITTKEPR